MGSVVNDCVQHACMHTHTHTHTPLYSLKMFVLLKRKNAGVRK